MSARWAWLWGIALYASSASAIQLPHQGRAGGYFCPFKILATVRQAVSPTRVNWSYRRYNEATQDLQAILTTPNLRPGVPIFYVRQQRLLKFMRSHPTPEAYAALFDGLLGRAAPVDQRLDVGVARLQARGMTVRSGKPSIFASKDVHADVAWGRRWSQFLQQSPKRLDLVWPKTPPQSLDDVARTLIKLSYALGDADGAQLRRHVPWASLPFGTGPHSYPDQIDALAKRVEQRTYRLVDGFRETLGRDVSHQLDKKLARKAGPIRLALGYLWQTFFPFYDPLAKFHPSEPGYREWRHERETASYRERARLKYYSAWNASLFRALGFIGTVTLANSIYRYLYKNPVQAIADTANHVQKIAEDPKKVAAATRAYEQQPGGNDVVDDYYNSQIRNLQAQIRENGDPGGELAKQIQFLERQRDFYKN
jgi:hypothetical protein